MAGAKRRAIFKGLKGVPWSKGPFRAGAGTESARNPQRRHPRRVADKRPAGLVLAPTRDPAKAKPAENPAMRVHSMGFYRRGAWLRRIARRDAVAPVRCLMDAIWHPMCHIASNAMIQELRRTRRRTIMQPGRILLLSMHVQSLGPACPPRTRKHRSKPRRQNVFAPRRGSELRGPGSEPGSTQ